MKIEVIQGDTSEVYKFQRKDAQGNVIKTLPSKMWITFKKTTMCKECLLQKTLENGISYSEEDNYYRFQLSSEETGNLDYGTYGFDIAILNENGAKKTLFNNGSLEIVTHYTHKNNEV